MGERIVDGKPLESTSNALSAPENKIPEEPSTWARGWRGAKKMPGWAWKNVRENWILVLGAGTGLALYTAGTLDGLIGGIAGVDVASLIEPVSPVHPVTGTPGDNAFHDMQGPSDEGGWRTPTVHEKEVHDLKMRNHALEVENASLRAQIAGEHAPSTPDKMLPETVVQYALDDGDGITQGIKHLRDTWPEGTPMPDWLKNLDSPQKFADWAEQNHFYTPDQVKDSVIMYKGDVLGIDKYGNLSIRTADGTVSGITDIEGKAAPNTLGNRDFSDSMPTRQGADESAVLAQADKDLAELEKNVAHLKADIEARFPNSVDHTEVSVVLPEDLDAGFDKYTAAGGTNEAEYMQDITTRNEIYGTEQNMQDDMDFLRNTTAKGLPEIPADGDSDFDNAVRRAKTMMSNVGIPPEGDESVGEYMKRVGMLLPS